MSIKLEVALASVEDARIAAENGADRLELNTSLEEGGLTPSLGTLIHVKAAVEIPVMVMIRSRRSGFCYTASEFKVMQTDVELALKYGADGIVVGILNEDGTIDVDRCREIREQIGDREAVFHRAFDVTPDPFTAIQQLIDIRFTRVMTSGQCATALEGADLIAQLIQKVGRQIEVLPASGVNVDTIQNLIQLTGCYQVHGSFRSPRQDRSVSKRPSISFSATERLSGDTYLATDADAVSRMRRLLDSAHSGDTVR